MKKLFLTLLIMIWLAVPAMAGDTYTEDNSATYTIELGDGQGAILIFGDNNIVYLPPAEKEVQEVKPNELTVSGDRIHLVLTDTDFIMHGIKTRYSRLVFVLTGETWELVWFEQ